MKQSSTHHHHHHHHRHQPELFWAKLVMRKWLNVGAEESDYSADSDSDASSDSDLEDALPRLRRRNSETFRSQYINKKEIRVCVGTWNVGAKLPPDDLHIENWLDISEPADMYIIGFQEIVPLNAGNIFGAEDSRPVPKWENIIRKTLNKLQPANLKFKCYSDPSSPSRFKPTDDAPNLDDEILLGSDCDTEEEIHLLGEKSDNFQEMRVRLETHENVFSSQNVSSYDAHSSMPVYQDFDKQFSSPKRLDRLNCLRVEDCIGTAEAPFSQSNSKLVKTLGERERIGLTWLEPPRDMLARHVLDRKNSFMSTKSFKASKSFGTHRPFKLPTTNYNRVQPGAALLEELGLESLVYRKRRSPYVRIISKQMVGILLTIWVRRSLRRHVHNVKVSAVGVGALGYIGNKGSISVSMSIYQTLFCFICSHLASGEKDSDAVKRNADVHEIHRRTQFHSLSSGLPESIYDHEKIIWLGDLNYRINLSYEETRALITRKDWSKLVESDQLTRELGKGCAFDGWHEGILNFPPTYKYESNSEKYYGEDQKVGRRTPAWCDRILSLGKGMNLLSYKRTELTLSDHRPIVALYMVEIEEFCPRKLQRALTFIDAEIENQEVIEGYI
ncbi:type IV inositol polyphosphate 5-phosphatase 3-like isoform X2 [Diospyros lotus]|uniref:type IV inositol polyphosphate 5-phosphatase 3-like isoform X2 n=1 Tax=Diospyros lotus TaxID=55363 RepID=UPI00224FF82C|nr:type IV inositol polyphosphate 5-phosphatase 3-like isoform X2 [Diospyros lotus]